ncbi:hypothetical protein ABPG75_009587 [Micractinium tetrahymenae]
MECLRGDGHSSFSLFMMLQASLGRWAGLAGLSKAWVCLVPGSASTAHTKRARALAANRIIHGALGAFHILHTVKLVFTSLPARLGIGPARKVQRQQAAGRRRAKGRPPNWQHFWRILARKLLQVL